MEYYRKDWRGTVSKKTLLYSKEKYSPLSACIYVMQIILIALYVYRNTITHVYYLCYELPVQHENSFLEKHFENKSVLYT